MVFIRTFLITGVLLPALIFFGLGVYVEPLSGDLTRIGFLAERDFGWNAEQPVLTLIASRPDSNPSVIVLGDSFSEGNAWQSVAARKSGLEFLTFKWPSVENENCVEAWVKTLKDSYPLAQYLVLQVIERNFLRSFKASERSCEGASFRAIRAKSGDMLIKRSHIMVEAIDPLYTVRAIQNSSRKFDGTTYLGETVLAKLTTATLFSNRSSDSLLYYALDDVKKHWTPQEIRNSVLNIGKIQKIANSQGIDLVVAVVPDKSTIYGKYFKSPQFSAAPQDVWGALDEQGVPQVNLRALLASSVEANIDLYLPNDTHLGNRGYVLMGSAIGDRVKSK